MGERNRTYSVIILFLLPLCLWGRDSVDSVNRLAADYVQASLVVCDPDDVLSFLPGTPWSDKFFLYFLIGTKGDRPCPNEQKLIVPTDLVEVWQQAVLEDGMSSWTGPASPSQPPSSFC